MYSVFLTKSYRKALKRFARSRDFDKTALEAVIDVLARGQALPREYLDHQLSGELKGYRECHVKNDLLLMYRIERDQLVLVLVDLGTHGELFGR